MKVTKSAQTYASPHLEATKQCQVCGKEFPARDQRGFRNPGFTYHQNKCVQRKKQQEEEEEKRRRRKEGLYVEDEVKMREIRPYYADVLVDPALPKLCRVCYDYQCNCSLIKGW